MTGPVIHVLDASRAVGVASQLLSDTQRDAYVVKIADEYEDVRVSARARGRATCCRSPKRARTASPPTWPTRPPRRHKPGMHVFDDWDLADLREYIDWTPFFRAWELAGNYPAILDDEVVGESARNLFADAQTMLDSRSSRRNG